MTNILKSVFISTLPLLGLVGTIYSVFELGQNGFSWEYAGALVAALPILLFFVNVFLNKKPRTDENLIAFTSVVILGFLMSLGDIFNGNYKRGYLAGALMIVWILYVKWYSSFGNRTANNSILKVGNKLPNFELENTAKNKVNANEFIGKPAIYMFYRGNWCPLCMAQIKEIAEQYQELERRGVQMILVSPQPHRYSASLARKFNIGFHFLVDKGNKAAKQLNILGENGLPLGLQVFGYATDTVMPTILITDKKGKIIFADLTDNYRVRPEPETFFKALEGVV